VSSSEGATKDSPEQKELPVTSLTEMTREMTDDEGPPSAHCSNSKQVFFTAHLAVTLLEHSISTFDSDKQVTMVSACAKVFAVSSEQVVLLGFKGGSVFIEICVEGLASREAVDEVLSKASNGLAARLRQDGLGSSIVQIDAKEAVGGTTPRSTHEQGIVRTPQGGQKHTKPSLGFVREKESLESTTENTDGIIGQAEHTSKEQDASIKIQGSVRKREANKKVSRLREATPTREKPTALAESEEQDRAAVKLQTLQRQKEAKRKVARKREMKVSEDKNGALLKLQGLARKREAKKKTAALREKKLAQEQDEAALKLQGVARRREANKRVSIIRKKNIEDHRAAVKLQGLARQRQAKERIAERKIAKKQDRAALQFQGLVRQREARKRVSAAREEKYSKEQDMAALKLQGLARKRQATNRVGTIRGEKLAKKQGVAALKIQGLVRKRQANKRVAKRRDKRARRDARRAAKLAKCAELEAQLRAEADTELAEAEARILARSSEDAAAAAIREERNKSATSTELIDFIDMQLFLHNANLLNLVKDLREAKAVRGKSQGLRPKLLNEGSLAQQPRHFAARDEESDSPANAVKRLNVRKHYAPIASMQKSPVSLESIMKAYCKYHRRSETSYNLAPDEEARAKVDSDDTREEHIRAVDLVENYLDRDLLEQNRKLQEQVDELRGELAHEETEKVQVLPPVNPKRVWSTNKKSESTKTQLTQRVARLKQEITARIAEAEALERGIAANVERARDLGTEVAELHRQRAEMASLAAKRGGHLTGVRDKGASASLQVSAQIHQLQSDLASVEESIRRDRKTLCLANINKDRFESLLKTFQTRLKEDRETKRTRSTSKSKDRKQKEAQAQQDHQASPSANEKLPRLAESAPLDPAPEEGPLLRSKTQPNRALPRGRNRDARSR